MAIFLMRLGVNQRCYKNHQFLRLASHSKQFPLVSPLPEIFIFISQFWSHLIHSFAPFISSYIGFKILYMYLVIPLYAPSS